MAQEWVRISHANGKTTAAVTKVEGSLVARWQVTTFVGHMREGVQEARAGAQRALEAMREVE